MISRILLFIVFVSASMLVSAQVFVYEDFSAGQMPPEGWSISGVPEQWSISWSSISSGYVVYKIPEAKFTFTDTIGITRLISPVIDLAGHTSVKFHFRFYYQFKVLPAPQAGAATRSAGGDWNTVWHIHPSANNGPKDIDLTLTNTDVGSSEFQFCLYLDGNLDNISFWYLDDITLIDPLPVDGFMNTIDSTENFIAAPVPVKGMVYNTGIETIHSAMINWRLNNGTVHSTTIENLDVPYLSFFSFTCADLMDPPIGMNDLVVWIEELNGSPDGDHSNDTLSMKVQRVCYDVPRKPIFEEFTSSTCWICPLFDDLFVPWCDSLENEITLVKYQMNWPSPGDPYYTEEGGVRKVFYDVGGVPRAYCDGEWIFGNTNLVGVQKAFDREIQESGMMKIVASHTLTNHVMEVNATILPFASWSSLKLYVAVIEKITYNNATPYSSDTSFVHVMMKMMPDAYGTELNLVDRQPYTFSGTVDLTGTHVERWDDLMVVAWVQDSLADKLIYQSCYSVENGIFGSEARLSDIIVNGISIPEFDPDIFDYAMTIPEGTATAPEVIGIPIDSNETVIVIPPRYLPGKTTIDVFAENNIVHNIYSVNFTFPVGNREAQVATVTAYPNPATDKVFISGADHSRISLFSATGSCLRKVEHFRGTAINLDGLQRGIYILKIERPDGRIVQKKIVVQ